MSKRLAIGLAACASMGLGLGIVLWSHRRAQPTVSVDPDVGLVRPGSGLPDRTPSEPPSDPDDDTGPYFPSTKSMHPLRPRATARAGPSLPASAAPIQPGYLPTSKSGGPFDWDPLPATAAPVAPGVPAYLPSSKRAEPFPARP